MLQAKHSRTKQQLQEHIEKQRIRPPVSTASAWTSGKAQLDLLDLILDRIASILYHLPIGQSIDKALFHKNPSRCASCNTNYSSFQTQARLSFQPFHLALEKHPKTKPLCTPIAHPMQVFTIFEPTLTNTWQTQWESSRLVIFGKGKLPNSRLPNSQSFKILSPLLACLHDGISPFGSIGKIVENKTHLTPPSPPPPGCQPYFSTFRGARKNGFFRWYWCPPCRLCHWMTSFFGADLVLGAVLPCSFQSIENQITSTIFFYSDLMPLLYSEFQR